MAILLLERHVLLSEIQLHRISAGQPFDHPELPVTRHGNSLVIARLDKNENEMRHHQLN